MQCLPKLLTRMWNKTKLMVRGYALASIAVYHTECYCLSHPQIFMTNVTVTTIYVLYLSASTRTGTFIHSHPRHYIARILA